MKVCAKCKKEFECGASTGSCWCQAVPVSIDVLEKLRELYIDCLCSSCLEEQSQGSKTK